MRNRYLVQSFADDQPVVLTGEEFHHAARVARIREGEEIELFDGRGKIAVARVASIAPDRLVAEVLRQLDDRRELPAAITVALALIQLERFELVLQKATELGATRFVPLLTDRVEIRRERIAGKSGRWEKILSEASKQSGRAVVPRLEAPSDLASVLGPDTVFYDAETNVRGTLDEIAARPELTLVIGPEGGWSEKETAAARAAGCAFRRLGRRRLRAETAAIAAVAEISLHLERE